MLEDYDKSISSTQRTRNSKKTLRMLEENWKHQWLPLCLARQARKVSMGRPVVRPMISNQHLRVSWKPVNPQDCVLRNPYRITEDHIEGKGENSLQHYNLVHKLIPMPQAMKIPAATAAVDKEWEKLENIPAWDLTKVRSKSEVIDEARTKGAKVHFTSLMNICRLKNAELEAKHLTYKGRVVLRGDIAKDDSGSYAVFTEQGSSASQMTAANVMDIISRLPACAGQAADAVSAFFQITKGRCSKIIENTKIGMPRHLDSSTTTQMAKIMVQYGRPSCSS